MSIITPGKDAGEHANGYNFNADFEFSPIHNAAGILIGAENIRMGGNGDERRKEMLAPLKRKRKIDDEILPNGWTRRQERVIRMDAPHGAHIIRRNRSWDAASRGYKDRIGLDIDCDTCLALLDELFTGRYSVEIKRVDTRQPEPVYDNEKEVGLIYHADAIVAITLHLPDGRNIVHEGYGARAQYINGHMASNGHTIGSVHIMVEKGAVTNAKKEALRSIGRCRPRRETPEVLKGIENSMAEILAAFRDNREQKPAKRAVAPTAPGDGRVAKVDSIRLVANDGAVTTHYTVDGFRRGAIFLLAKMSKKAELEKFRERNATALRTVFAGGDAYTWSAMLAEAESQKVKKRPGRPVIFKVNIPGQIPPEIHKNISSLGARFREIIKRCPDRETAAAFLNANKKVLYQASRWAKRHNYNWTRPELPELSETNPDNKVVRFGSSGKANPVPDPDGSDTGS